MWEKKELVDLIRQTKPLFTDEAKISRIIQKGKSDYVTETDMAVQNFLKKNLKELDCRIQFLGEEGEQETLDRSGEAWILDPVDGTTNLMHHFQMSTISLALVKAGVPVLGIVYQPFTDELFYAEKGEGAFLDDRPICVSAVKRPEDSLIFLGPSPYEKEKYGEMIFRVGKRIYDQCQDIRSLGSAALELAYVACGRADGYFERELKPWDFAAGALILQEAGGRVLNWDRKPLCYYEGSSVLADNGKMGDWMLDALEP